MPKRYFIELGFMGTRYHGWQIQPNADTVQQLMEEALSTILREQIKLTGAGRTDSGVHSSYFVAHFDSNNLSSSSFVVNKLNRYLKDDIAIYKITEVPVNAHARFDAISRTYRYIISRKKQPFLNRFTYNYNGELNIDMLKKSSFIILKTRDFSSFAKLHSNNKTSFCNIHHVQWEEKNDFLVFTISADRFLRNMIRALTGTLLDLGRGKINLKELEEIIISGNNQRASASAPAKGLYLTDILYPDAFGIKNNKKDDLLPFIS